MAVKSALKVLTDYFNQGDGKRPLTDWRAEIKELKESLGDAGYAAFASEVAAVTGDTIG